MYTKDVYDQASGLRSEQLDRQRPHSGSSVVSTITAHHGYFRAMGRRLGVVPTRSVGFHLPTCSQSDYQRPAYMASVGRHV